MLKTQFLNEWRKLCPDEQATLFAELMRTTMRARSRAVVMLWLPAYYKNGNAVPEWLMSRLHRTLVDLTDGLPFSTGDGGYTFGAFLTPRQFKHAIGVIAPYEYPPLSRVKAWFDTRKYLFKSYFDEDVFLAFLPVPALNGEKENQIFVFDIGDPA